MMCVVLVRQFVHLANHFFNATQFNHGLSESCIRNEPIVNAQEFSLLAFLLELIRDEVLVIPFFLPRSCDRAVGLPDVKVRDREEIENGLDVLLVFCCIISQEVPARAVDDASVPAREAYFALCFWFNIE